MVTSSSFENQGNQEYDSCYVSMQFMEKKLLKDMLCASGIVLDSPLWLLPINFTNLYSYSHKSESKIIQLI